MKATTAINRLDHNDECVGCGAHLADPCGADCPIETGQITAPVVLRYACKLLMRHPMGIGYDTREAIFTAAHTLTGETRPYPLRLHEAAVDAVTGFLACQHGPGSGLTGAEHMFRMSLFAQVEGIAMTLYATAAELEGSEFDPDEFGDFR